MTRFLVRCLYAPVILTFLALAAVALVVLSAFLLVYLAMGITVWLVAILGRTLDGTFSLDDALRGFGPCLFIGPPMLAIGEIPSPLPPSQRGVA